MITPEEFLETQLQSMNLHMDNKDFTALATEVAGFLKTTDPGLLIDYGCGTGVYSEIIRQNGMDVMAFDIWAVHRNYCETHYPSLQVIDTPRRADTLVFIEVAEHMTDAEITAALSAIQPEKILFSSTPEKTENDALWGHINIKSEAEWLQFFKAMGFEYILHPGTPTRWSLYFARPDITAGVGGITR